MAGNAALIDKGYLTSRVSVPAQSLASGTLRLDVAPGRAGELRSDDEAMR